MEWDAVGLAPAAAMADHRLAIAAGALPRHRIRQALGRSGAPMVLVRIAVPTAAAAVADVFAVAGRADSAPVDLAVRTVVQAARADLATPAIAAAIAGGLRAAALPSRPW